MFRKLFAGLALAFALLVTPAVAADNLPATTSATTVWDTSGYSAARSPLVFKSASATVITSETTVWTPAAGKKFRLMGFCLTQGVATGAVTLKDNTAGTTIFTVPQNTLGAALCVQLGNGILSAAANNVLTATGVSTETITGTFFGLEE